MASNAVEVSLALCAVETIDATKGNRDCLKADLLGLQVGEFGDDAAKFRLVCIYRPPIYSEAQSEKLMDLISVYCNVNHSTVICGDFNLPSVDWTKEIPSPGSISIANRFITLFDENALIQYVKEPTRGSAILDLILSNDELMVIDVSVCEPFSTSDHASVTFSMNFTPTTPKAMSYYDYPKANFVEMNRHLSDIDWIMFFSVCASVQDCYEHFLTLLYHLIEIYVTVKIIIHKSKTYPEYIIRLLRKKNRLWRTRHQVNGKEKYKECAKKCKFKIKKYYRNIEKNIVQKQNLRAFYSLVNKSLKKKTGVAPLRDQNGNLTTDDLLKARLLCEQFSSVFTAGNNEIPSFSNRTTKVLNNVEFEVSDVLHAIKRLPSKLSGTPDDVPAFFFKHTAHTIAHHATGRI